MTDAVNCALHVSVNSGTDSEVEVTVDRSSNTSVHLRYFNLPCSAIFDNLYNHNEINLLIPRRVSFVLASKILSIRQ